MAKRGSDAPAKTETEAIFVALEDLSVGDAITAEAIKLEEWPVDKIPEGAISELVDVEGKRPRSRIYAGSPILDKQLGGFSAATENIPAGYRVVPVKVDTVSGGSNMIHPGDRVDVAVHLERCPAKSIPSTQTRIILQDIKVFAINDTWELDPEDGEEKMKAQTISLLVTPTQGQKVILASELGKIRLVMRGPGDADEAELANVSVEELLGHSETGDRDSDSPSVSAEGPGPSGGQSDFVKYLTDQQQQQTDVPGLAIPSDAPVWRMRSIAGEQVTEVVLELADESTADDASGSPGFSFWNLMSEAARSGKKTPADSAAGDAPEGEEHEEEKEQDEEEPTDDDSDDVPDDDVARWNTSK
jgi:pilus assembly protein CpaB